MPLTPDTTRHDESVHPNSNHGSTEIFTNPVNAYSVPRMSKEPPLAMRYERPFDSYDIPVSSECIVIDALAYILDIPLVSLIQVQPAQPIKCSEVEVAHNSHLHLPQRVSSSLIILLTSSS